MNTLHLSRRRLIAAATLGPALLAACGGGGGDTPAAAGTSGATAGAQSFTSGPISGLGSIIVGGVRFEDDSARIEDEDGASHSRSDLKLGMMVQVQASSIDDNTSRATAALIRFGSELKGPVASLDATAQTILVLDQRVEVRAETVFDESLAGGFSALAVGRILEIHALFDSATGHYLATRIEREDSADAYRLRGSVSRLDTTAKTFQLGDAVINTAGIAAADLPSNLSNNARVRVRLQTTQVNGQWVALSVRSGVRRVDDIADARLRGFVTAFTSAQQFEVQGVAIDAANARFEPNAGAVSLGALVEVRGRASNGTIAASRVKAIDRLGDEWRRVELHGTASALNTGAQTFVLREVTVNYSRVLEWKNGSASDLADGKSLEVKGLWSDDRSVLFAVVVEFE